MLVHKNVAMCNPYRKLKLQKGCLVAALLMTTGLSTSYAQGDTEKASKGDVVMVTAQRREQSLQEVPGSVSALGEDEIKDRQLSSFVDYLDTIPNVSLTDNGADNRRNGSRNIGIRGIAPGERRDTVAIYLGETPVGTGDPEIFDINRIEVLRGPQGTLYGRATTAGAIKIIPNTPDATEFSGLLDMTASSYSGSDGGINLEGRGMINVPIIEDVLAFRASGVFREMEGYVDYVIPDTLPNARSNPDNFIDAPNVNDERFRSMRLALEFTPTDALSIMPAVQYQEYNADARSSVQPGLTQVQGRVVEAYEPSESDLLVASLDVNYDIGPVKLTSVTSLVESDFFGVEELSTTIRGALGQSAMTLPNAAEVLFGNSREQITEELRITYSDDSLNVVAGFFYSDLDYYSTSYYQQPDIVAVINDPMVVNDMTAPGGLVVQSYNPRAEKEKSFFLDVSYFILPQLELSAGIRYYDFQVEQFSLTGGRISAGGGVANSSMSPVLNASDDGFVPKARLAYYPTEDLMFYVLYSEGFRLGGANNPLPDTPQCNAALAAIGLPDGVPAGYSAESLKNYEGGAKSQWLDGRVTFNTSGFHMEWSNLQETTRPSSDCTFSFVNNVGKATATGFEIETQVELFEGFTFTGGLGYVDAKVASDPAPGSTVQKMKGDRLTDVAKLNFSLTGEYTFPVAIQDDGEGYIRLDYTYYGKRYRDFGISPGVNPRYDLLNLRIGLRTGNWEASMFARNLFDSRDLLDVFGSRAFLTRPRTIGVNLRKSF